MLTQEQQEWALKQVVRWLEHCPYGVAAAHAMQSGLLPRLMSGLEPLPKAPPQVNGKPCYALYDGKVVPLEGGPVEVPQPIRKKADPYVGTIYGVAIENRPDYVWVDKDQGLLVHRNGDTFKVWRGEYESHTLYGKEPYLEDRWLMRLYQKTEPVVVQEYDGPQPIIRPRRNTNAPTAIWHHELALNAQDFVVQGHRPAQFPPNPMPARNPNPEPNEALAEQAGTWARMVRAADNRMVFNADMPAEAIEEIEDL